MWVISNQVVNAMVLATSGNAAFSVVGPISDGVITRLHYGLSVTSGSIPIGTYQSAVGSTLCQSGDANFANWTSGVPLFQRSDGGSVVGGVPVLFYRVISVATGTNSLAFEISVPVPTGTHYVITRLVSGNSSLNLCGYVGVTCSRWVWRAPPALPAPVVEAEADEVES